MHNSKDETQLKSVVEAFRMAFLAVDPKALSDPWAQDHHRLSYIAMEKGERLRGWAAIHRYLNDLPNHLAAMQRMDIQDLEIDVLGDVALLCFDFAATVTFQGGSGASPAGRVSMLLQHRRDIWRIIHYHESARAAVVVTDGRTVEGPISAKGGDRPETYGSNSGPT